MRNPMGKRKHYFHGFLMVGWAIISHVELFQEIRDAGSFGRVTCTCPKCTGLTVNNRRFLHPEEAKRSVEIILMDL